MHNYPKEKAFLYNNKIIVKDAASKHNAKEISIALDNYWDDSIKVRKIRQYGIFNTFGFRSIECTRVIPTCSRTGTVMILGAF